MTRYVWVTLALALSFLIAGPALTGGDPPGCEQPCSAYTGISSGGISGPSVLCINQEGMFSVYGSDPDICGDPFPCPDGVHASWDWGAGAVASGSMSKANPLCWCGYPTYLTCHWTTPGVKIIIVTLNDDGHYYNDSGSACPIHTVTVVEVVSLTGPDSCVLCQGIAYTFTAETNPPGNCDLLTWSAPGGTPSSQTGGCSFQVAFNEPGTYQVSVSCGTSTVTSDTYTVAQSCSGYSVMPSIVETEPVEGTLPACIFGETNTEPQMGDWDWVVCFDCTANLWKVEITKMDCRINVVYDYKGKPDAAGAYVCQAAIDVKSWLDYAGTHGEFGNRCNTTYIPKWCIGVHEQKHVEQITPIFLDEAQQARNLILALYRDPAAGWCSLNTVTDSLDSQVLVLYADMLRNVKSRINAKLLEFEEDAMDAEATCLSTMLDDICDNLPPEEKPCAPCGQ